MAPTLLVSYSPILGGAERLLLDLAPSLGDEVCLAAPTGPLASAARGAGLRVFEFPVRPLRVRGSAGEWIRAVVALVGYARDQRRLIEDLSPAVVIAWAMRPALACLLPGRPSVPVVFAHHDLLPGRVIAAAVRLAARRARLTIALSHALGHDLDPGGSLGDGLAVIHPGVDITRFASDGEPEAPPVVLVLGAIVGWKRPDFALDVLEELRRIRPALAVRLRIVGAPLERGGSELLARLRERVERDGLAEVVQLPGEADAPAELRRTSVLLHCAPREPVGMVVLEALASARPVVVPDGGGPVELVDHECAIVYPPSDARAAAAAVLELVSDPARAQTMGRHGRELVRERFELGDVKRRFANAVAAVASPSASPDGGADTPASREW